MRRMCLNWKVVATLAAVGAGIYALTPSIWTAAAPLLIAVACPLAMVVMMLAMRGTGGLGRGTGGMDSMRQQNGAGAIPAARGSESQPADQPVFAAANGAASPAEPLAQLKAELSRTRERQEALARQIAALEAADTSVVRAAEEVVRRTAQAPRWT